MSEKCRSCGAEIEYAPGTQSLKCPYCDAVNEIKKAEDELPTEVDLVIPLTLTADDLEKQAYGYMASGDYTPDDMLESVTFISRDCMYVPAYIFRIEYEATWTASFGYDRQEPYTAYRSVTSNGHTRQEAYTAYRTVTDWRPANGVDSGVFSVSTYAGNALNESDLTPNTLVPLVIENGSATAFNESFLKGVQSEAFLLPEASAYSSLDGEIKSNIDHRVQTHGQGDHQKDWHWNATMGHSTKTLYVPICHAVFDYQGENYHFWIDGIGEGQMRATPLPEDKERKKLVNLGFIPAGVSGAGFLASWYLWGFTWPALVAVGALAGYASLRRNSILGYSKRIRESLLTQIQASATSIKDLSTEEQERLARAFQRPEKPLLAKTHNDKVAIPALALFALIGSTVPAYFNSPEAQMRREAASTQVAQQAPSNSAPASVTASPSEAPAPVIAAPPPEPTASAGTQPQPTEAEKPAVSATEQTTTVSSDFLQRASSCDGIQGCISIMLEAADPRSPEALSVAAVRIAELNKAQRGDRKAARDLNQQALNEFKKGNAEGAISLFKQANAADPGDVEILSNLGFVALRANRPDEAVQPLVNALTIDPRRTSTWTPIAELYVTRGKVDQAIRALLLAYEFSGNKEKTVSVFTEKAASAERESMRPVFTEALKRIGGRNS